MDCLFEHECGLAEQLIAGLQELQGVTVQGITDPDAMQRRVPTVSFTHSHEHPDDIARALAKRNIFVWSGHNYAVETARSLGILDAGGAVRVGPVHYNTSNEINEILNSLGDILN
jgi:selenocysteine lyase/cysteine desulfurase